MDDYHPLKNPPAIVPETAEDDFLLNFIANYGDMRGRDEQSRKRYYAAMNELSSRLKESTKRLQLLTKAFESLKKIVDTVHITSVDYRNVVDVYNDIKDYMHRDELPEPEPPIIDAEIVDEEDE